MAQERSNVDNLDRVDPANSTLESSRKAGEGYNAEATKKNRDVLDLSAAADDDTPAEAEHIKGQIEETRKEMGETIDAIQDRLSFSNISEQVTDHVNHAVETAKGAVYEATIGKAADMMKNLTSELSNTSIVKQAKENPLPFILIGAGAGLLAYQGFKGNGRSRRHEFSSATDSRASITDSAADKVGTLTDTAGRKLDDVAGSVTDVAGSAYEKVAGAVDHVYTGVGDAAGRAYEKVGELRSTAVDQYDHYMDENPLAVGAVALALGAAVGLAIPATQYEGQLMGDARQGLLEKAQTTASHLLDKTKEAVSEVGRNATDQAKALTEH